MAYQDTASPELRVVSAAERESYLADGYLLLEALIGEDQLARLRKVVDGFVDESRKHTASGDLFDLAPGHSAATPKLRRLKQPDENHAEFWALASGEIADVAADLLGPDVAFHHSKLNFKWSDGGDAVAWHQDIQFYPHTNYDHLAIGVYLEDTGMEEAPLAVLPGSHHGPLYDQYDADGNWRGCLSDVDVAGLDLTRLVYLEGPAGSVTVHSCRAVHGSRPSESDGGRPLLLNAFGAADAFPYTPHPQPSSHAGEIVRGRPARWARHDPRPCQIPPDWSGGYTSIFAAQSGEDAARAEGD